MKKISVLVTICCISIATKQIGPDSITKCFCKVWIAFEGMKSDVEEYSLDVPIGDCNRGPRLCLGCKGRRAEGIVAGNQEAPAHIRRCRRLIWLSGHGCRRVGWLLIGRENPVQSWGRYVTKGECVASRHISLGPELEQAV